MSEQSYEALNRAVQAHLKARSPIGRVALYYSMDEDGPSTVEELSQPAGLVGVMEYDGWMDNAPVYRHHVLPHYTWLRIMELVEDAIHATKDYHHIFLERLRVSDDGIISPWMGS